MTPLLLFILGLAVVYVSTVITAFSALMRLSLRLMAERNNPDEPLARYLEDPLRLFIPARVLLTLLAVIAAALMARVTGIDAARGLPLFAGSMAFYIIICEHIVPMAVVRRNPERVLELLLPSFEVIVRVLHPLTKALIRLGVKRRDRQSTAITTTAAPQEAANPAEPEAQPGEHEHLQEGQARELLRSLVEFRETMVREVMTPRPDIVAISADATLGELHALVREQQYSRLPVYGESLDNIVGLISIKDLLLSNAEPTQLITPLIRPTYFVPETKRVPELLKEFQRKRVQAAIVVDEYGGTAGLVTLEDLLEEIVGEIRDEYDVESEAVQEEANGTFVFSGRTHVRELAERLKVEISSGEGYETVGGYLLAHVGRVPGVGETFEIGGLSVEVLEAERRRITRVRVRKSEEVGVDSSRVET
jgi:CBS domain containing-hemolysin-like protein